MDIAVFGNGWLGNRIASHFNCPLIADRIEGSSQAFELLADTKADVVVNAIGKTGVKNIDWCEDHKAETFQSNVMVPISLAQACADYGIKLIHIGSGCIYEGAKHWYEDEAPNFTGSFYSKTKIWAEKILIKFNEVYGNVLQLRIRIPFDDIPHPRNLFDKLHTFDRVLVAENSYTYIPHLLDVIEKLGWMEGEHGTGIYNVVCSNYDQETWPKEVTYYWMINEVFRHYYDHDYDSIKFIESDELAGMVGAGRSNCTLSVEKLGCVMKTPDIKDTILQSFQAWVEKRKEQL